MENARQRHSWDLVCLIMALVCKHTDLYLLCMFLSSVSARQKSYFKQQGALFQRCSSKVLASFFQVSEMSGSLSRLL